MIPLEEILKASGLTRSMKDEFVATLIEFTELQHFAKDQTVIHEDSRDRDMFILVEGKVSINLFVPGTLDRMESIVTLRAYQVFGEFSLIDGAPRSAAVKADTDIVVYRLSAEKLLHYCETNCEFGYRLMQNLAAILAARIRDTTLLVRNNIIW